MKSTESITNKEWSYQETN
uniref:Uncharacterized protein n=1 Tax=Arundo donax TaxID=35708 RepID=A0A0A9HT82_ARUDO